MYVDISTFCISMIRFWVFFMKLAVCIAPRMAETILISLSSHSDNARQAFSACWLSVVGVVSEILAHLLIWIAITGFHLICTNFIWTTQFSGQWLKIARCELLNDFNSTIQQYFQYISPCWWLNSLIGGHQTVQIVSLTLTLKRFKYC